MIQGELERELPNLRRYARALTGSQLKGDALVREAIEATSIEVDENDSRSRMCAFLM